MNIDRLRKVDRLLGIPWVHLLSSFRGAGSPSTLRRALVVKLFGLGNLIMLTPALRALRGAFPGLEIDLLTFAQNEGAARMYPQLLARAHLVPYSVLPLAVGLSRIIARERGRYDLIVDAEQFIRYTSMVSLLLAPRMLAGLPTPGSRKSRAYHVWIPYREDRPLAREYLDLAVEIARRFGKKAEEPDRLVAPSIDPSSAAKVSALVPQPSIGVCVGGRSDAMEKRYPHWEPLLRRLRTLGLPFVFTGTSEEAPAIRPLHAAVGGVDLAGKLTQLELVEVLRRTSIFLSNDTGPLHLAAATGAFTVGFFGPTDPRVYRPYTPRHLVLWDPRNVPSITNRDEKRRPTGQVFWVPPEEAFERIRSAYDRS